MMLFRREAYLEIGGHESVSSSVLDDISLARQIKEKRLRWRVAYVADLISCRMYHSTMETIDGFTKNLFAVFDYRLLPFFFVFIWLFMMFLVPLVVLVVSLFGWLPLTQQTAIVSCLVLSISLWLIPYIEMRIPFFLAFLYPFTILANIGVDRKSVV